MSTVRTNQLQNLARTVTIPLDDSMASGIPYTPAGTGAVATDVQSKLREFVSVLDFGASTTNTPAQNAAAIQAAFDFALSNVSDYEPHPSVEFPELYDITGHTIRINKPTIIGYPDPYYFTIIGTGGGIRKDDAGFIFTAGVGTTNVGFIRCQNMSFKSVRGAGTTVWDCNKLMYIDASFNEYFAVDRVMYQDSDVTAELFQSSRFVNEHIKDGSGYAFLWKRASDIVIANCKIETRDSGIGNVELSAGQELINQNNTVRIENNVIQGLFLGEGTAFKLGNSWGLILRGNYTETCKKYFDLHSLVKRSHIGLTVSDNSIYLNSTGQKNTKAGTYNQAGGTTLTVTSANHGLNNGDGVYLDFTSGAGVDGSYVVSNVTANTFDITTTAATTSGNVNAYYSPLIVGNLNTVNTASLRIHNNQFSCNVSDYELFCFVGTGTLNSSGDYAFAQRGFNNKNINVAWGRNNFTTSSGRVTTTSGISKVFSFIHTETNLLGSEVRTITISFSDTDITNPMLLQNIYQVYPNQISSVSVLGILPIYTTGNSGTLYITIANRTASTIASVGLNVVCMQLAGY